LLSYGGWISVMTFLGPLLVIIDRLVIATVSGAQAVTSYTVPYDLASKTMVISSSLSIALFPHLASASPADARNLAERATAVLVAVMTPVVISGIFLMHPFLIIWLGTSFAAASAGVAELIMLGVWINALVIPHHARLMALGNPRSVVMIYLVQIPIYFGILWMGLHYYGVVGAAGAWSLRVLIDTLLLLYVNSALRTTLRLAAVDAILVLAAAAIVFIFSLQPLVYWSLALFLIVFSVLKDRELLVHAFRKLSQRTKESV